MGNIIYIDSNGVYHDPIEMSHKHYTSALAKMKRQNKEAEYNILEAVFSVVKSYTFDESIKVRFSKETEEKIGAQHFK
jgi:hypothetical protein